MFWALTKFNEQKAFFFAFFLLFILVYPCLAEEQDITNNLSLVQLKLNGNLDFDSEVLVLDGKVFFPVRQIAQLIDLDITFDRDNRIIKFKEREKNSELTISLINKSIQTNGNILDPLANQVFWVQKSFFLNEEALINRELMDKLFEIKTAYDPDQAIVYIKVDRDVKLLRKTLTFEDEEKALISIKPTKHALDLRTIQTSYSANFNDNTIQSNNSYFNNKNTNASINTNILGEIEGGEYRIGPVLSFNNGNINMSGFNQTWSKKLNKKTGLIFGDSSAQLSKLTSPGNAIFGLQIGSLKNLHFDVLDNLSYQGVCENSSELKLFINDRLISRRICKEGKYDFQNIPRLIDPKSVYKIIQKNTDGVETEIRRENLTSFSDLIPYKEKYWQLFAGHNPVISSVPILSQDQERLNINPERRITLGGSFQYGLKKRATLEFALAGDRIMKSNNIGSFSNNNNNKSLNSNISSLDGLNASISLLVRPKNNLGLRWRNSISQSRDLSLNQSNRSGRGLASSLEYDWRGKKTSSQGEIFINNPSFYSVGSVVQNQLGINVSLSRQFKWNQSINLNFSQQLLNFDKSALGGQRSINRLKVAHSLNAWKNIPIQNIVNYVDYKDDFSAQKQIEVRSSFRKQLNRNIDINGSIGLSLQNNIKPLPQTNSIKDASLGSTYRFGKELKQQISFGARQFIYDGPANSATKSNQSLFAEGRFSYKKLVYQPSFQIFSSNGNSKEKSFTLSNGLFWQQSDGTRLGLEYTFSNTNSSVLIPLADQAENIVSSTKTMNHSLALNFFTTLGFLDGKPHLLSNSVSAGYLKGKIYLDLNKNGKFDEGEKGIPNVKITLFDKPIKSDEQGEFVIIDVPRGTYDLNLDTTTLPIALSAIDEKLMVQIDARKITEASFAIGINSGSVSGEVSVIDLKGEKQSVQGIVVIALNNEGKEAAYTYTNPDGSYTLSELEPGDYIITLDKLDISKRNLTIKEIKKKINIPIKLDDIVEISDISFEASQAAF